MKVLYSDEPPFDEDDALMLCGGTPRSNDVKSWRPQALEILSNLGFQGTVLVPERKSGWTKTDYLGQVMWEKVGLLRSGIIIFWIPRCMKTLPCLTSNIEMGYWLAREPNKVIYGRPDGAPHTRYLDWLYTEESGREPFNSLEGLLQNAVKRMNS